MSSKPSQRPLLIVLSAPAGAGKTTLASQLLAARSDMVRSVSCTTRAPRGAEKNGRDYFFVDQDDFSNRLRRNEFLEHAEVHGNRYGTLRKTVEEALYREQSVLMVIDVQGARQVRGVVAGLPPDSALAGRLVDIFVMPPSLESLRERLQRRGEDSDETIEKRLRNARGEMESAKDFRYVIVNGNLEEAASRLREIVERESKRL